MPATIDGLSADLRRFFEEKLPSGEDEGPGTVKLVFDTLGTPLSTREFTGPDTAAPSEVFARQRAAELADQLPVAGMLADGSYLARSGSRLSDWYANMVSAGTSAESTFDAAKADALKRLENNKWVVVGGGFDTRYVTNMSPRNFYAPEFDGWDQYSIKAGEEPPPAAPSGPPIPYHPGGSGGSGSGGGPIHPGILVSATLTEPLFGLNDRTPALPVRAVSALTPATHAFDGADDISPTLETTSILDAPADSLVPLLHTEERRVPLSERVAAFDPMIDTALVSGLLGSLGSVTPTSGSFSVQFEYCMVRFERPWWNALFLARNDWRVGGVARGGISSGTDEPTGPVTLLTNGMLVVRKLSIKAQWTDEDLEVLPNTVSLGPFCLVAGSFDKATGTITREGLQAIAWMCEVPPVLPPSG